MKAFDEAQAESRLSETRRRSSRTTSFVHFRRERRRTGTRVIRTHGRLPLRQPYRYVEAVGNVMIVSDSLGFTIRYSDGGEGWIMAQVEEVPGAISQGRTRSEARENVIDALKLMLKPEPVQPADPDRELLELPLAS